MFQSVAYNPQLILVLQRLCFKVLPSTCSLIWSCKAALVARSKPVMQHNVTALVGRSKPVMQRNITALATRTKPVMQRNVTALAARSKPVMQRNVTALAARTKPVMLCSQCCAPDA